MMVYAKDDDVLFKGSKHLITLKVKHNPPLKRARLDERSFEKEEDSLEEGQGLHKPVNRVLSCPELVATIQDHLPDHDLLVSGMVNSLFRECFTLTLSRKVRDIRCFNWLQYNFNPDLRDVCLEHLDERKRTLLIYYFNQGVVEKTVSVFQDFLKEQYHIFHQRDYYPFIKKLQKLQSALPASLQGLLIILENMCWSSMVRQDMYLEESRDFLISTSRRKRALLQAQNQLQGLMVKIQHQLKDNSFRDDFCRQPLLNLYHFYRAFAKIHGDYPSPLFKMEMAYVLKPLEESKNKAISYFYLGKVFASGDGKESFDLSHRLCLMALIEALNERNEIFWKEADACQQFYHLIHVVSFYFRASLERNSVFPTIQPLLVHFLSYINGYAEDIATFKQDRKITQETLEKIRDHLFLLFYDIIHRQEIYPHAYQMIYQICYHLRKGGYGDSVDLFS